jgi:hypothetical protein
MFSRALIRLKLYSLHAIQSSHHLFPGQVRTKAIYMSNTIAKLAGEFSKEKNIAQREVVEGALVEYLIKYGYRREVEAPLKNL